MVTFRSVTRFAALALVAGGLHAQSGGFMPGELVLQSPAVQGSGSGDGAIVRIDPFTGQASILLDLIQSNSSVGAIAYDPFRDALIFCGGFTSPQDPARVYLLDGYGATLDVGLGARSLSAFAPASQGRIYFFDRTSLSTTPVHYIDANNVEHILYAADGVTPFVIPSSTYEAMIYHLGTNALIVAARAAAAQACSGGSSVAINVRKFPLATDGVRVIGPESCAQFVVDAGSGTRPVGLSRGPAGALVLVVDSNSNATQPRMLSIDANTLAISVYASNGHAFAAATSAGTYSSARNETVILDTGSDVLRSFALGSSGAGIVITPSMPISSAGSSSEGATLIEIPSALCGLNNVSTYCTAKTTSGGCVPQITSIGGPSMSTSSGFVISANQIEPQKAGLFFYGLSGPASAPFQGGFLCVQPPTRRTALQTSGGMASCSGTFLFDWNAWVASGGDAVVSIGSNVHGQFWFRDPGSASTTGLSGGVKFSVCP